MPGKRPPKGGRASPEKLKRAELTEAALELRRAGCSYREIARELKVHVKVAHRVVTEALKEQIAKTGETAEMLVRIQRDRLEAMYLGIRQAAEAGNTRAVEVALRLLEREARLCGLDAPAKQEVKVSYSELSDEELLAEAARLRLKVGALDAPVSVPLLRLPGEAVQEAEIIPPSPASSESPPPEAEDA